MPVSAKQMQKRLQPVANTYWIQQEVQKIVERDNLNLVEQKKTEFERGLRPDGTLIGDYRSESYRIFKQSLNPLAGGHVDLMLTKAFISSMFVKPFGKGYIFDASNNKTDKLKGQYGLDIMGLNQEWFNQRQREVYRDLLIEKIKNQLNT